MPDLLAQSSAWLEEQRLAHMTRPVVYERPSASGGPATQVQVQATVGRTVFEIGDASGSGALVKIESRDFLVQSADLVLGGAPTLPQRGDRVRESDGQTVYVYEVMAAPGGSPSAGGNPWRYSDLYRRTLRIHTKQVEVVREIQP